jgi:transcriptional regulator with XRE-family HTH domain
MREFRYRNDIVVWRMNELGWTVEGMAEAFGIDKNTISRVRQGLNVTIDTLWSVIEPLRLCMKFIFDFELPIERAARAVLKEEAATASSSGR